MRNAKGEAPLIFSHKCRESLLVMDESSYRYIRQPVCLWLHRGHTALTSCDVEVVEYCMCCMHSALQIFQKEYHPFVYKAGKGGTKEGLSLFGQQIESFVQLCVL